MPSSIRLSAIVACFHRDPHVAERAGFFHERSAAVGTLETLVAALVLAVLVAGFVLAAYDDHRGSFRFSRLSLQSRY